MKLLYQLNLHPRERGSSLDTPHLSAPVFGAHLSNPIGISAGLDKDGEIPDALFALGAGVVEIGGCKPAPPDRASSGCPRSTAWSTGTGSTLGGPTTSPFVFGPGCGDVLDGKARVPPGSLQPGRLLAVQIAQNKETNVRDERAVAMDYVYCVRKLAPYADVVVVNVSSPNTPGLRDLQATEPLTRLLSAVVDEASKTGRKTRPKVMVKVSPDEDEDAQVEGIVQAIHKSGVDGVIVGNTTKRRTGLVPHGIKLTGKEHMAMMEQGGYSGPAMFGRTLDLVTRYRKLLDSQSLDAKASSTEGDDSDGRKVIFATGGITNGEEALKVLNAGASVAMVYTGLVYGGPGTVTRIKAEMRQRN
ncbi:dihydroorotate reductase PyrE [Ophiocordyceps sinensis CO18]|uniref:Dihydroorotate reductase PyrE n=1 Tax=Ophiocordyceps sinensis (strain Co18 / CGMCC 3.14243) TaxID=911162 RepID=T5AC65_OPHSC|nr:dihydroorotate reductase PyrE [Ophiocordyceps sinensis CO18]